MQVFFSFQVYCEFQTLPGTEKTGKGMEEKESQGYKVLMLERLAQENSLSILIVNIIIHVTIDRFTLHISKIN